MPKFTMIALTNAKPGRDAEFVEWYDTVHLDEVLEIPGIVSAQRCGIADIPAAGEPQWRYVGVYTIEADDPAPVFDELMRRYGAGEMTACSAMEEISYNGIFADAPVRVRQPV